MTTRPHTHTQLIKAREDCNRHQLLWQRALSWEANGVWGGAVLLSRALDSAIANNATAAWESQLKNLNARGHR